MSSVGRFWMDEGLREIYPELRWSKVERCHRGSMPEGDQQKQEQLDCFVEPLHDLTGECDRGRQLRLMNDGFGIWIRVPYRARRPEWPLLVILPETWVELRSCPGCRRRDERSTMCCRWCDLWTEICINQWNYLQFSSTRHTIRRISFGAWVVKQFVTFKISTDQL